MRATGEALHHRMETGGANVDKNFAGSGIGFREGQIQGGLAQDVDNSGILGGPPGTRMGSLYHRQVVGFARRAGAGKELTKAG